MFHLVTWNLTRAIMIQAVEHQAQLCKDLLGIYSPARSFTLVTMWKTTTIHQENKTKWDVTWIYNWVISQDGLENGFDAWDHFFKAPTTVWFGVFFSHMIKSARVFRVSCLEVPEMRWTKRSIDPKFASQLSRAFLRFCSSIDCLGLVIWLRVDSYATRPFLIYIYIFHEWDMLLIHQACLRHQAERTWLKHAEKH